MRVVLSRCYPHDRILDRPQHWIMTCEFMLQVGDLLDRMTPTSARFDLQTSAFTELVEQQSLSSQPGIISSTEPW